MIEGLVVDTKKLDLNRYQAIDENNNIAEFTPLTKNTLYYSQTLDKLGLYNTNFKENLPASKKFFIENIKRQHKLVMGGKPYMEHKVGLYSNITYFDLKHFYTSMAMQIANHVDEDYKGKKVKNIVKAKQFLKTIPNISNTAKTARIVQIQDLTNAIKIDANDKSKYIKMLNDLATAESYDKADGVVSKVIRNALSYGFGFQQKHARISNISALVFYLCSEFMGIFVGNIKKKYEIVFSHTDSFMTSYVNTKDIEDAIREATSVLDSKYFGNTGILAFGLKDVAIKNKFEDLMIINPNAYIYSTIAPRGKVSVGLAIAGLNTTNANGLGIARDGVSIDEFLSEHSQEIFSWDKSFFERYEDKEFLYSILKYRTAQEYEEKLINAFRENKPIEKAVIIDKTIMGLNRLRAGAR